MPKIIIREYDKTESKLEGAGNFTVVIPGRVREREYDPSVGAFLYGGKTVYKAASAESTDGGVSVFDDNNIYECNSKSDFINCIGPVESGTSIEKEAVAPTCANGPSKIQSTTWNNWHTDTEKPKYNIYTCTENTSHIIGKLKTSNYILTLEKDGAVFDANVVYARIEKNKNLEGSDAVYSTHYGNQMACELLALGYTILYKKMEKTEDLTKWNYWSELTDKAEYDFRYISSGSMDNNSSLVNINKQIVALASYKNTSTSEENGRGDCFALCEIGQEIYKAKTQAEAIKAIATEVKNNYSFTTTYSHILAPCTTFTSLLCSEYVNRTLPASFYYLACAAKSIENNYAEWFAVAGYTRGICDYNIETTGCKFGENAINALQPRSVNSNIDRAVNLIVKIRDNYYLWGNRTGLKLPEDETTDLKKSHFLNVRQLCCTLKKKIYIVCRQLTYDPNSDILWINFCNAMRPTLEKMKTEQGISDYKFVKEKNSKQATVSAKIRIVPIEATEDFYLDLFLENSLSGVAVGIEESD